MTAFPTPISPLYLPYSFLSSYCHQIGSAMHTIDPEPLFNMLDVNRRIRLNEYIGL